MEPDEDYEYDTIQIIHKVNLAQAQTKHCNTDNNNVMFDEIADLPKRNLLNLI